MKTKSFIDFQRKEVHSGMRDWVPLLIHPSSFSPLSSCIISPSFALVSGILFLTFLPFNRNRDKRKRERVLNKEKRAKGDVKRMKNGEMYKKSHLLSPHCVDHSLSRIPIVLFPPIHSFNLLSFFSSEESHDFYSFFSPIPLFFSHFFVTFLHVHFPRFLSLSFSLWSKRVLSSTHILAHFPFFHWTKKTTLPPLPIVSFSAVIYVMM